MYTYTQGGVLQLTSGEAWETCIMVRGGPWLLRECSVYSDGATALMCLKGAAVLAQRCVFVCVSMLRCVYTYTHYVCVYIYIYIYIAAWNAWLLRGCGVYSDGATALMCLNGAAVLAQRCACVCVCVLVLIGACMCVCIASVSMVFRKLMVAVRIHIHTYIHTYKHSPGFI
jgi:hypothetical protein